MSVGLWTLTPHPLIVSLAYALIVKSVKPWIIYISKHLKIIKKGRYLHMVLKTSVQLLEYLTNKMVQKARGFLLSKCYFKGWDKMLTLAWFSHLLRLGVYSWSSLALDQFTGMGEDRTDFFFSPFASAPYFFLNYLWKFFAIDRQNRFE